MKKLRFWGMILLVLMSIRLGSITVEAGSIYTSPYVTFAPGGQAWTTDAGNQNVEWYAEDGSDDVVTGVKKILADTQTGEHYYAIRRTGTIPVSQWIVHTSKVNCCHNAYPASGEYHGVEFTMQTCYKPHFSAWRPICADCGRIVSNWNFYMSKNAAASLGYLEMGDNIFYYYLCPFNNNLEMGMSMRYHMCQDISANRYRVMYDANTGGEIYSGYMAPSFHMYNNATEYEGREVTPQTHLNLNVYGRIGWEFAGWNTAPDGSGAYYEDGAEIWNLCESDYEQDNEAGTVYLYAMWKPSESVLEIDPNGGYYRGEQEITELRGSYGSSVVVNSRDVWEPEGPEIFFDTCGGEPQDSMRLSLDFVEWKQSVPFHGRMQGNDYYFEGSDGSRDRITALYEVEPEDLPEPYRENYSFTGWFYDPEYKKKAGDADERFVTTEDVTLYAQWAELTLESEENGYANYCAGAVNLYWNQEDEKVKSYKIYQCAAGRDWQRIYVLDDALDVLDFYEEFNYCEQEESFVVPYTGFYRIEAYGAQGGNYEEFSGGLGGAVQGSFWLEEGQEVTVCVGGQYGYNGGGYFSSYTWGGGYTSVSMGDELLLIAGGGGGAGATGDGGAGGMNTSLVEEGHNGESGGSGGGGGYLGGRAGEMEVHYHEDGVCNHAHEGDPSVQGGCYTDPIKCGQSLTHTHTGTEHWYWGGSDEVYCPNCGADATKGEDCTGHDTKHYRHDCPIHGKQASNTTSSKPSVCSTIAEYGLTCGQTDEYFCGYPYDGYVISAKPAYGGSSYVNEEFASTYTRTPGVREGDGFLVIKAENLGFYTDTSLEDVPATDMAAPRAVDVEKVKLTPVDESTISVQWTRPQDLGTVYYHKAESYLIGSNEVLSVSNTTADNIVTGIYGYLYLVDNYPDTKMTWSSGRFMDKGKETLELEVGLTYENQYLHVAAVDLAENYSETIHIPVGNLTQGSEGVKWPVLTKPLVIDDTDSVHPALDAGTYYVKSDGRAPFTVRFGAYIQGAATESYQINYAITQSTGIGGESVRGSVYVPGCSVEDDAREFPAEDLRFKVDGECYLQNGNYILATKSGRCRKLDVEQEYTLAEAAHGKKIQLTPIAGVDDAGTTVYSDYEKDVNNGLWIIGDGEAPIISGLDVLESLPVLDRRTQEIRLQVTATDTLSGVKEFYLEIENLDNGARGTYLPGEDGVIVVDICADEPIFSGDFTVNAYAVDNVGNERSLLCGTTEFDLQVNIERILEPHDPVFKCGESGYLNISSWGYVERIEVEFPEALTVQNPNLNHVYEYELKGAYMQQEQMTFMIPLGVPSGTDYTVMVRAYKGDKMLERHPAMAVLGVDGSILDELRTRLR